MNTETVEEIRAEASGLLKGGRLNLEELWLTFNAHGGKASIPDLGAFVLGLIAMSKTDIESLYATLVKLRTE